MQNTGAWSEQRRQAIDSANSSQQLILRFYFMQDGQFIPSAIQIYKAKTLAQLMYGIPIWILGFMPKLKESSLYFLGNYWAFLPVWGTQLFIWKWVFDLLNVRHGSMPLNGGL